MHDVMRLIRARVYRRARDLPPSLRRDFGKYLHRARKAQATRTAVGARTQDPAYWLVLPGWLAHGGIGAHKRPQRVLGDVLWGQYCLYLAIRIKDDLFDQQARSKNLSIVADGFMAESRRAFEKYFEERSSFWSGYQRCIETTNAAIRQIDALQRADTTSASQLLREYAKQSAVFKVGSLAVCTMSGSGEIFARISSFADHMAIASQIIDDLQDITEDLKQKRLNYAARVVLQNAKTVPQGASTILKRIAGGFLYGDGLQTIFGEVRSRLRLAGEALGSLRLPESSAYLSSYNAVLNVLEQHLHRERVQWVFGREA